MKQVCRVCERETEHVQGRGVWVAGCHLRMGSNGPHCIECCHAAVNVLRELTDERKEAEHGKDLRQSG